MKLGIALRYKNYSLDQQENINTLLDFIGVLNPLLDNPFISFTAIYRNTGIKNKYAKSKKLNIKNKDSLIQECIQREYKTLFFYNGNFNNHPPSVFSIDIDKDNDLDNSLSRLEFKLEEFHDLNPGLLTTINTYLSSIKNFWYGYTLITNINSNNFHSEISWIPISTWNSQSPRYNADLETELGFYQSNVDKFETHIAKAYWGNFLNRKHVEKLGGIFHIKSKAPVYLVQELPDGGAYLQLTEDPNEFLQKKPKEKLMKLDNYLSQLILPNRPRVIWDKMVSI